MTLVPVQLLSPADVRLLGENVRHEVRLDRLELEAVNRSLQVFDEEVDRLRRLPRRRPARTDTNPPLPPT